MRVLLDTNIVLDLYLQRMPWFNDAQKIVVAHEVGRITALLSALTVCNLHYVLRKAVGKEAALEKSRDCIRAFEILPVAADTLRAAMARSGSDFEDNIQQILALEARADAIVTRDSTGFRQSVIPAMAPTDFLLLLSATTGG